MLHWLLAVSGGLFALQGLSAEFLITHQTLSVNSPGRSGFSRVQGSASGVLFTNEIPAEWVARNRLLEDGAGVAAGDIDGDGRCDLYFCRTVGSNALFRNLGDWTFEEVTMRAGVACVGNHSTGAVLVDVDGDTDLDLLVAGLGTGVRLFLNDGRGQFTESKNSGLRGGMGSRSLTLGDFDGDRQLDLYVANYRASTIKDSPVRFKLTQVGGKMEVPLEYRDRFTVETTDGGSPVLIELGEPDVLYRNVGQGRFEEVSWTNGVFRDQRGLVLSEAPRDWGLSAIFRDVNADGDPDLYVCNDFYSVDRIWVNDGHGGFRATELTNFRKLPWASMAVDFADINRDGLEDLFVADMLGMSRQERQSQRSNLETGAVPAFGWGWGIGEGLNPTQVMRNTLFLNQGNGDYAEIGQLSGVQATGWTWGALFLDVDLDGYEDLLIANGHLHDHLNSDLQRRAGALGLASTPAARSNLFGLFPELALPNMALRNQHDLTFADRSQAWGFDRKGVTHGMILADLDGDGDMDVVTNDGNAEAGLYRNETAVPRITVQLRGREGNTSGVGATILVKGAQLTQSQQIISGGRYLSGDEMVRAFAAQPMPTSIEVRWRSGQRSVVSNLTANTRYILQEPALGR